MSIPPHSGRIFSLAATLLGAALCPVAQAQTWVGGGSDDNVTTGANWSSGSQPDQNENITFGPSSRTTPFFDFAGGARDRVGDITFTPETPTYTIQGDGTKSLRLRDIHNDSGGTQIFEVDLIFLNKVTVVAGAPIEFGGAIEAHTGNNELEFSGDSSISLTSDNQVSSDINLILGGGITLDLAGTDQSFNSLTVTGDAFIDFDDGANLALNHITVEEGASLNALNWSGDSEFIVQDEPSEETQSNILVNGAESRWGFDEHGNPTITPVPEPRVYGAIFMLVAFGFLYLRLGRRSRRADR